LSSLVAMDRRVKCSESAALVLPSNTLRRDNALSCLSVYLPISLIWLSVCIPICVICLCVCLSVCLPVCLPVYLFVFLSLLSGCLFVHQSASPVCLFICLPMCLSVCLQYYLR
jgi:hypothetical protein